MSPEILDTVIARRKVISGGAFIVFMLVFLIVLAEDWFINKPAAMEKIQSKIDQGNYAAAIEDIDAFKTRWAIIPSRLRADNSMTALRSDVYARWEHSLYSAIEQVAQDIHNGKPIAIDDSLLETVDNYLSQEQFAEISPEHYKAVSDDSRSVKAARLLNLTASDIGHPDDIVRTITNCMECDVPDDMRERMTAQVDRLIKLWVASLPENADADKYSEYLVAAQRLMSHSRIPNDMAAYLKEFHNIVGKKMDGLNFQNVLYKTLQAAHAASTAEDKLKVLKGAIGFDSAPELNAGLVNAMFDVVSDDLKDLPEFIKSLGADSRKPGVASVIGQRIKPLIDAGLRKIESDVRDRINRATVDENFSEKRSEIDNAYGDLENALKTLPSEMAASSAKNIDASASNAYNVLREICARRCKEEFQKRKDTAKSAKDVETVLNILKEYVKLWPTPTSDRFDEEVRSAFAFLQVISRGVKGTLIVAHGDFSTLDGWLSSPEIMIEVILPNDPNNAGRKRRTKPIKSAYPEWNEIVEEIVWTVDMQGITFKAFDGNTEVFSHTLQSMGFEGYKALSGALADRGHTLGVIFSLANVESIPKCPWLEER